MKKLVKIWIFLLIFSFQINVLATNNQEDNNTNTEIKDESSVENNGENKAEDTTDNSNESSDSSKKSSDNTLKNIKINDETIVCKENLCEKIIEDNSIDKIKITYQLNDTKATIEKGKSKGIEEELKEGVNEFTVLVTAENGDEKTYIFKITKKLLSTDSTLSKLVINEKEIKLESEKTKYTLDVSFSTKKLEIEAIPNDTNASVDLAKDNKISYDFFDQEKEIKIKVFAEAGEATTYVINVTRREEADATLKKLTIKNASIDFESEVYDYETKVLKSVETLEIEATPNDQEAKVTINKPKSLQIGENTVTIKVVNDGCEKVYTIKVERLDEEDKTLANLKSLEIEGYELDFKEDVYEYDLKIGDVNYLNIEALPKLSDNEVEITGNLDLEDGSIIKIKVYYDDENYNVYKINIIKEIVENENDSMLFIIIGIIVLSILLVVIIVVVIIKIRNNKNKKNNKKLKEDTILKEEPVKKEKSSKDIINLVDEEIEEII